LRAEYFSEFYDEFMDELKVNNSWDEKIPTARVKAYLPDGTIVGFVRIIKGKKLADLSVREDMRRRGIAQSLMS
jgi:ribosomal protein S18 acetylase RimI-like enzyme